MTEEEYLNAIRGLGTTQGESTLEQLKLADKAVEIFPHSPRLWCLRGQLIQLAPPNAPYSLSDAFESLIKAVNEDDQFAEVYEELGYFYDAVEDNPELAEQHFRMAIMLGGGVHAYAGIARVLAELGRVEEIEHLLKESPYSDSTEIAEVLREIAQGVWQPTCAKTGPETGRSGL